MPKQLLNVARLRRLYQDVDVKVWLVLFSIRVFICSGKQTKVALPVY